MTPQKPEKTGRLIKKSLVRPAVEVDCSTWDTGDPSVAKTTGRFVKKAMVRPAVEIDCSGWLASTKRAAMSIISTLPSAAIPPLPVVRLSVGQYHRMIETGVLTEDDPGELLEGWIIAKMPQKPQHAGTITRIQRRLDRELGDDWITRVQSAITTRDSEPEPDVAAAQGPEENYWTRHPGPEDIGLVVEVAESTLEADRHVKGRIYARARLPTYWIANLIDRQIEVYTVPRAGKAPAYRNRRDYKMHDTISLIIRGREIARIPVKELLLQ